MRGVFLPTMTREQYINDILPLKNKLFAYSFRIVHSRQEAEDVVQDILLKVWEKRNELDSVSNIEAWCMTMVRNRSLDRIKLKSNRSQQIEERHDLAADVATPLGIVEMDDLKTKLRRIVQGLPLKQREVIQLRDFQGKTYQEIAEIMSIDMNLVKVTIHRARQVIKQEILKLTSYGVES